MNGTVNCGSGALVGVLWCIGCGLYAVWRGVRAWRPGGAQAIEAEVDRYYPSRSDANWFMRAMKMTREDRYRPMLRSERFSLFLGLAFTALGLWFLTLLAPCGGVLFVLPPIVGPLEFRFWPPMLAFIALAAAIGLSVGRQMRSWHGLLVVAGMMAWAFAVGEGAAFHTGIQAVRWAVVSFGSLIVAAIVSVAVRALRARRERQRGDARL